jgi:hypothetical protein
MTPVPRTFQKLITPERNAGATFEKPDEPMNHHKALAGVFTHPVLG